YRLRCVKMAVPGVSGGSCSDSSWVTQETSWPTFGFYFEFNGQMLEARRKIHWGRDKPIDITAFVRSGKNTLKVSSLFRRPNPSATGAMEYVFAIEEVACVTHDNVVRGFSVISGGDETVSIKASLNATTTSVDDDDDIIFDTEKNTFTITVAEPYTRSKLCEIPVRGKTCKHRECFDLETFLSAEKRFEDVSAVDVWRCPICKEDVRPGELLIDDWITGVIKALKQNGQQDTRAIIVKADGTWSPIVEEKEDNAGSANARAPSENTGELMEIVELD
ncbi:hypothetical protein K402DRAFT_298224, partial [Aulographum hederae CBS 113979]